MYNNFIWANCKGITHSSRDNKYMFTQYFGNFIININIYVSMSLIYGSMSLLEPVETRQKKYVLFYKAWYIILMKVKLKFITLNFNKQWSRLDKTYTSHVSLILHRIIKDAVCGNLLFDQFVWSVRLINSKNNT